MILWALLPFVAAAALVLLLLALYKSKKQRNFILKLIAAVLATASLLKIATMLSYGGPILDSLLTGTYMGVLIGLPIAVVVSLFALVLRAAKKHGDKYNESSTPNP